MINKSYMLGILSCSKNEKETKKRLFSKNKHFTVTLFV